MGREPRVIGIFKRSKSQRIARLSIFSTLCVIGSFIHPPSPIQTIAFDSAPGFFAALYFGSYDGALICGIGHLITSLINGFPLGWLHIPIALGMAVAGGAMGVVNRVNSKWGFIPATLVGIAINTALFPLAAPLFGWVAALTLVAPFLLLAATLNGIIAALGYVGMRGKFWIK
ncbi:ECF transporter S component [Candidatus Bathyarchaeota archaeon]|nr:ECF transporter S component [Candidatus Bathyarchaeota archaeon]